ncbi:MAG TPA: hypothetical protein VGN48_05185 [Pedococcus sp.]|nr:hypothetical protein [Pedococcus sp.]
MTEHEKVAETSRLGGRLRQVLAMLGAEFLLGMGANLVGLPSEVKGAAHAVTLTLIGVHALLAIGIVVVAFLVSRSASEEQVAVRPTTIGGISVAVTFVAGLGTLMTGSAWLSFVMAAGFLAAAAMYVAAYAEVSRRAPAVG